MTPVEPSLVIQIRDALIAFLKRNEAFAEPAVLFLGFIESVPFASWLFPSSILFVAIAGLHGASGGAFWHLWIAGTAGAMLGDLLIYTFGRTYRVGISHVWPLSRFPNLLQVAHDQFERWGFFAVLIAKFTGPTRPFIALSAGMAEMRLASFLAASFLSSVAWSGAFLVPASYGARAWFN